MKPQALCIAVLGARRSGKTWLAAELAHALGEHGAQLSDDLPWLSAPDCTAAPTPSIAAGQQAAHDLTLLMGLDLPAATPAEARAQEAEDARLRAALAAAGIGFQVIYGRGAQRLENALLAVKRVASTERSAAQFGLQGGRVPWQCGNCSDPDCEHRLFTGLLAARAAAQ